MSDPLSLEWFVPKNPLHLTWMVDATNFKPPLAATSVSALAVVLGPPGLTGPTGPPGQDAQASTDDGFF